VVTNGSAPSSLSGINICCKMPSIVRLTISAFGITSLLAGVHSLMASTAALPSGNSDVVAADRGNALAAIAMGIYYNLAAHQDNTAFFIATVPMRMLSAAVFWAQGWPAVAAWEGTGSLSTILALWWDSRKG